MSALTGTKPILLPKAENYPLLKMRNIPSALGMADLSAFVRAETLPDINCPKQFVDTLRRWELRIGTVNATLSGMLAVSGVTSGIEIAAGLESFERSFDMLKPELTVHTDNQLRCLVQNLRDPLKYSEDTNARLAIHTFEANLLGDSEEVGNCVLVAALFACLRMRAGNLAGEAHYIQNLRHSQDFHSTAFLPDFNRIFDVVALSPAQISMPTVEQYNRYVISSIFSFVMALAMSKARSEMEELALATPIGAKVEPSRFEPYARMLAIAEAINPFLSSLYSRKAVLYAGTDAFRDTIELGDAVGKLRGEAIHFL